MDIEISDVIIQVFRQKHLLKTILSYIPQIKRAHLINISHIGCIRRHLTKFPIFTYHCSYNDIISVEWMVRNKYYNLLFEKINRNEYLWLDKSLNTILLDNYITGSLAAFNIIYERFHYWFKENRSDILNVVLTGGSVQVIQKLLDDGFKPTANSIQFILQRGDIEVVRTVVKSQTAKFWTNLLHHTEYSSVLSTIYNTQIENIELVRFFFTNLWPLYLRSKTEKAISDIYKAMFERIIELRNQPFLKVMMEEYKVPYSSIVFRTFYIKQLFLCQLDCSFYEMANYLFKSNLNDYEYNRLNFFNGNPNLLSKKEIFEILVKVGNVVYPDAIMPAKYIGNYPANESSQKTIPQSVPAVQYNSKIEYGRFWTVDEFKADMTDDQIDKFIEKYYDSPFRTLYPEDNSQLALLRRMERKHLLDCRYTVLIGACANGVIEIVKYILSACELFTTVDIQDAISVSFYFRQYETLSYLLYKHKLDCNVNILQAIGISGDIDGFNCFFGSGKTSGNGETCQSINVSGFEILKLLVSAAMYGRSRFLEHVIKFGIVEYDIFVMMLEKASDHQRWNVFSLCVDMLKHQFDDVDGQKIIKLLETAGRHCIEQGNIEMLTKLRDKYNYVPIIESHSLLSLMRSNTIRMLYYLYDTVPGMTLNKQLLQECYQNKHLNPTDELKSFYTQVMNDPNSNQ